MWEEVKKKVGEGGCPDILYNNDQVLCAMKTFIFCSFLGSRLKVAL